MSKQALQQRLAQHSGLLASQRQLLQRLLLQLEFNQPDRLQLVGSSGSGKSTLISQLPRFQVKRVMPPHSSTGSSRGSRP